MLSQKMGSAQQGGVNVMNAQRCANEIQQGFKPLKKTLMGNQLQIQTLSFCMKAVAANGADNIDPKLKPQIAHLNGQYYKQEGALGRAPLAFMLDGQTYQSIARETGL